MRITKRMKDKASNTPVQESKLLAKREALANQIIAALAAGRSFDSIAKSLKMSTTLVQEIARERLGEDMDLINDINFQRQLQIMKVRALQDARFEAAVDGDNAAMNHMLKLIPLENGLLGLNDQKSIQEIVYRATITETNVNVSEIGEKAAGVLEKYLGEQEEQEIVENTHTSQRDMGELLGILRTQERQDAQIVDAEIIEDDDES